MRWLVTGGCGFIGTSLIADLTAERGHTVRIIDNFCTGSRNALSSVCGFTEVGTADMEPMNRMPAGAVELIDGDIVDGPLAFKACAGADVVVHLAANTGVEPSIEEPALDCTVNVFGTLNMLEAARHNHVSRFVFASSGAPIGQCVPPIHEELAPHPVSPYGASKLAGEGYCSAWFRSFGLETVALRFGNVYGPRSGHKSSVVARFIRNAMTGEPLEIFGDGRQTRDFIFIDDLIRAVRRAVTVPDIGGETFQIATNAETTVGELVEQLIPALAEAGIGPVEMRHAEPRLGDVQRNFSDTSKARARLGWHAETPLADGLRRTVTWFADRAANDRVSAAG